MHRRGLRGTLTRRPSSLYGAFLGLFRVKLFELITRDENIDILDPRQGDGIKN